MNQQGQAIDAQLLVDTITGRQREIQQELQQSRAVMYDLSRKEKELVAEFETLQGMLTRAAVPMNEKQDAAKPAENET